MTVQQAERSAADTLATTWWFDGDADSPLPVDPMYIARALGILVVLDRLPPDESGRITITPGGSRIHLNGSDHPNRQRFTCAHELGHYIDRRSESPMQSFVDYRDTLAGLGQDPGEISANQFAAALLMPAHLVKRFNDGGESPEGMARRFGTSAQALRLRLRNLNLA